MNSLYDRFARSVDGARRLASARLRREALRSLHVALKASGLSQTELADRLRIRKSAVSQVLNGDGNLRIKTLAEYLSALGYELDMRLVEAGEPRKAVTEQRPVRPAFPQHNAGVTGTSLLKRNQGDLQVIETGSHHVLMEMTVQSMGSESFQFTGSAHLVAKDTASDKAFLDEDRFKLMSRREIQQ
ncbi:helix-turn-helix domain-containing protein [Streptomyces microflavus]|uniref:helix-turn-helix domain-containing protein n=1 Tax=Streptomyces microflavus TaxID=1919 RepID=UPI00324C594A